MNTVTLDPGTLTIKTEVDQDVLEVKILRVIDFVGKRAVAELNVGSVVLWGNGVYETKKAGGGWTDAQVENRVKSQIEDGKLKPARVRRQV